MRGNGSEFIQSSFGIVSVDECDDEEMNEKTQV